MGGFGSGNHAIKKTTVEWCRCLSINRLAKDGCFVPGNLNTGDLVWYGDQGQQHSVMRFEADLRANIIDTLYLSYAFRGSGEALNYAIQLQCTNPHFGGRRFWFICVSCGRRAGVLYLPPGERVFACRICHDLTYLSCQEHDARLSVYRKQSSLKVPYHVALRRVLTFVVKQQRKASFAVSPICRE
jgi:hypothetical protein